MKKGKSGKMLQRAFCLLLMLCLCLGSLPVSTAAATDHEHIEEHATGDFTLPATVDGKVVLSWTVDGEEKKPGDVVDATAPRRAAFFRAPVTSGVNSVKITSHIEGTGIRFTADINRTDFEALVALYGEHAISYGMLITPDEYVQRTGGVFTREALRDMLEQDGYDPAKAFVQVNAGAFFRTDETTLTVAGSLYAFSNATYNNNPAFTAVAFIDIDSDGDGKTDMTVYGDYAPMASHTAVTILRGGRAAATDTQKGWIDTILARFRAYTPDHLLCPHELTAVAAKAPTCTAAGVRAHYVCGLCGEFFADDMAVEQLPIVYPNVSALGHDYENDFCTRCGDYRGSIDTDDGFFDPALPCDPSAPDIDWDLIGGTSHYHTLTFISAKAPTCTEEGNAAYYYCTGCDRCFSDADGVEPLSNVTRPALGHAYLNGTCTACGESASGKKPYIRIDENGNESDTGSYILFGEYPQSLKADGVTVTSTTDSRGYYLGSDGSYYAEVIADTWYNGYSRSDYKFGNGISVIDERTYYFKVEPIRWRILAESGGQAFLLCDSIIANRYYSYNGREYDTSAIRRWLNSDFYKTTFNDLQQSLIETTLVDNSLASTGDSYNSGVCEDTRDKIFLLSYKEVVNRSYGFSVASDRCMIVSDYARATGACMSTDSSYYGFGYWWLRSPDDILGGHVQGVNAQGGINTGRADGDFDHAYIVESVINGVVPAMQISLSDTSENPPAHTHSISFVLATSPTCTKAGNIAHYCCFDCGKRLSGADSESVIIDVMLPATGHTYANGACTACGVAQAPGLYAADGNTLISSWDALVQNGSVTLSGTTLTAVDTALSGELVVKDGITDIGSGAFNGCSALTVIRLPDSLTTVGDRAFYYCSALTAITIPASVTYIGSWAITGCTALVSITVATGNPVYHGAGNCIIETASDKLVAGCKTSVIPAGVVSIANYAFYGCAGLTSVTLPNSVLSIGSLAFCGCTDLEAAYFGKTNGWSAGSVALAEAALTNPATAAEYLSATYYQSKWTRTPLVIPTPAKDPTCTEVGNIAYWTDEDGKHYSDAECTNEISLSDTVVPAKGHNTTKTEAVAPTCTDAGAVAYYTCSACDKRSSDAAGRYEIVNITVPATGHSLTKTAAVAPTCTTAGNILYYTCSVCGLRFSDAQGKYEVTNITVPATGHDLREIEATAPTCTGQGSVKHYYCVTCMKRFSDTASKYEITDISVPALGHSLVKIEAVAPTCTEAGSIEYYTCSVCGVRFSDAQGNNEVTNITVPATGHGMRRTLAVAPTCTEAGNITYYTCSVCGKHYSSAAGTVEITLADTVVAAKGHSTIKTDAVAPTCTEAGSIEYYTCSSCGKRFSDAQGNNEVTDITVPATGHSLTKIEAVAPTCTEAGSIEYYICAACGKRYSDAVGRYEVTSLTVPALGHSLVKTEAVAPTCTEVGNVAYYTCSVCGKLYSDAQGQNEITDTVVPALGHTLVEIEAVPPTCTEAGNVGYYTCFACGKLFSDAQGENEITDIFAPAPGHSLVKTAAVSATCIQTGNIEYYTCSVCGNHYRDAAGRIAIALKDTVLPAMGTHTYVDGVCTGCGKQNVSGDVLIGDGGDQSGSDIDWDLL